MANISRREHLKLFGCMLGIGAGATSISTLLSESESSTYVPKKVAEPVESTGNDLEQFTKDVTMYGQNVKLAGVMHTRNFARSHYHQLEKLVAESSVVVLEGMPPKGEKVGSESEHEFRSYFFTMVDFCKKYSKPIITLDNESDYLNALVKSQLFGSPLVVWYGQEVIHKAKGTAAATRTQVSRRDMAIGTSSIFGGLYMLGSNFLVQLHTLSSFGISPSDVARSSLPFNHVVDHRNVELTDRLEWLAQTLPSLDSYMLVNFGRAHTEGVDHYIERPAPRAVKRAMYKFTYGLIDNNTIARYDPTPSGWEKTILRE